MIPDENKEDLTQSGLNFIRAITEAYGPEEGMKLWETIASTLDPSLKGAIFFSMLTGRQNGTITITGIGGIATTDVVPVIKAIRTVACTGLKEAKDLYDDLRNNKAVVIQCDLKSRLSDIRLLRSVGCFI